MTQPGQPDGPGAIADAALGYLARGWCVVPVQGGGKRPLVAWQVHQHQRPTPREVRRWFARWPDANVGLVTGSVSGLVVIDVDPRHGGTESLQKLTDRYGPMPATVEAESGGGGRHLYFAHPGVRVPNRVALMDGLDVRADGGMVVAPPSRHASGSRYRWRSGCSPTEAPPAPLPPWLLQLSSPSRTGAGHPTRYWCDLLASGVDEGRRNETIASIAGHLLHRGVDPVEVTELLLCWNRVRCRPPLSDNEVIRTVASIRSLHQRHETR